MAVTLIIGDFGSGKSTLLKTEFLSKVKPEQSMVYALMRQDMNGYPYEPNKRKFIDKGLRMVNSCLVIDEAKTFIPKKEPEPDADGNIKKMYDLKLVTLFLNARKYNNMIFIVFHGLREIPLWLLMYSDYWIRFNTMDQIDIQARRFGSFPNVVKSLTDHPVLEKYVYDEIKVR